jgi:competence protein ComEC
MALGVLVMILASFNYVPAIPAKLLEWSISILDRIINSIASLEQFVIQDIPFNLYLLASIFLFIISLIIWFEKPNFSKTAIVLSTLILFQISYFETHRNIEKQLEWVVFNTKKNTLIVERHGKEVTLFATDSLLKMDRKNRVLNSYLTANFSSLKTKRKLKNLLFFNGNKILILDSLGIYPKNTNPDILVLTQSSKINLDRLFQTIKPKMVVADASNYKNIQKLWKISCAKQEIPFHATGEKGFYRLN